LKGRPGRRLSMECRRKLEYYYRNAESSRDVLVLDLVMHAMSYLIFVANAGRIGFCRLQS